MNCTNVENAFRLATEAYAEYGVDTAEALRKLSQIALSIHAWQGDDVVGFESTNHALTGGCQVTGSYPGRARTPGELRQDLDMALKLIPGKHRVCLQGHEMDCLPAGVDRDALTIEHFAGWLAWSKERGVAMDVAPAFYSHPKLDNGLSLSHPDAGIRRFWVNHGKAIRRIAAKFGEAQGSPSVVNFWAPDGYKDVPADRQSPRQRLAASLDEIFTEEIPAAFVRDAVEPKLFGIGTESYTVGSHEFYMGYAVSRKKLLCLDSGHFHPTETISDKLSAIFCFLDEVLLHVSRGVRWDSDHVLLFNDDLQAIAQEAVRYDYLHKIHIGLDYFDASINRIGAWAIGARNMQKALLAALLEPRTKLLELESVWDNTSRLALLEEAKMLPFAAVWNYFCLTQDVPVGMKFMDDVKQYERTVLSAR